MNYQSLFEFLEKNNLSEKLGSLKSLIEESKHHGDYEKFLSILKSLPNATPSVTNFSGDVIKIGRENDLESDALDILLQQLKNLIPWRKGPYKIFDIFVDTEWRSDLKWNRLKGSISSLKGRLVLDVGSGNGYHCWRMFGEGAAGVIGIDPYLLSVTQFNVFKNYANDAPVWVLPLGVERMPENLELFDTVFSMGVLYHRRSPFDHLFKLKSFLTSGGELILETLVIEGNKGDVLVPEGRYAKMRNVWFIPSPLTLESWLKRAGFKNIRLINVTKTTTEEQRRTDWMPWESLSDFLDVKNPQKTIEGYPAPVRAVFVCEK
jgi:tRNA (mo5U34)-methyltransferase